MLLVLQSPTEANELSAKAVEVAYRYKGHTEVKYNRSPVIDRWTKLARYPLGSSWCMIAVWNWYEEASKELKVKNPLQRTASCSGQLKYANMIGSGLRVIKTSMIGLKSLQKGDIFIMKHGKFSERDIGKLWAGHTGLIVTDKGKSNITIEGNTNSKKTRESKGKDGVWQLERLERTYIAVLEVK